MQLIDDCDSHCDYLTARYRGVINLKIHEIIVKTLYLSAIEIVWKKNKREKKITNGDYSCGSIVCIHSFCCCELKNSFMEIHIYCGITNEILVLQTAMCDRTC